MRRSAGRRPRRGWRIPCNPAYVREIATQGETYVGAVPNGIVDDIVVWSHLLSDRKLEVPHARAHLPEVDIAQSTVEEDFAREEAELEPQLLIVDRHVAAEVEQGVVEIGQGLLKVAEEEIGHALLEVGDGEILVQTDGALVTHHLRESELCSARVSRRTAFSCSPIVA